jgi:hypothetical protein
VGSAIGAAWTAAQRFQSSQEGAEANPPEPPKEMLPADDDPPQSNGRGQGA